MRHLLTAALLLAAAPAFAQEAPQSEAARQLNEAGPIACPYVSLPKRDWPLLIALVKKGMNPQTNPEKLQFEEITTKVEECRKRHGWGLKSRNVALRYVSGRLLRSNATYELKKYGITDDALLAVVGKFDAATRAQVASYQITPAATQSALETLGGVGFTMDKVPEAERAAFGPLLGQGIVGLVIEQDAVTEFSKR